MPEKVYEIIALAARYWFALLGVVIVWQSFIWLRRDRREKHRRLRQLPDAGMIGEMVVLEGSDDLPEGSTLPVPREGTLGYLRTCDVVVPVEGVAHQHCDFTFVPGKGLMIFPRSRCSVTVDEEAVVRRRDAKQHPMQHGSRVQIGEALLRLRVFVGLEVERHSAVMTDEEVAEQPAWQDAPYIYHQVPAAWNEGSGCWEPAQPFDPQGAYPPPCLPGDPGVPNNYPGGVYPPSYAPYDPAAPWGQYPPFDPQGAGGQAPPLAPYGVYPPYDAPCGTEAAFPETTDLSDEPEAMPRRRSLLRRRREDGEA